MKTSILLFAVTCLAGTVRSQQPGPAPKPGPEHQKLATWDGDSRTQRNKEMVRRWIIGLWDEMSFSLLTELATPDYAYHGPDTGPEGLKGAACIEFVKTCNSALPGKHNTIEGQIAEGDRVVTWGTTRWTQPGAVGETPAAGKPIALPWTMITELRGGKIAADREFYDRQGLTLQVPAGKPADPAPSVESTIKDADAAWAEAIASKSVDRTLAFYAPDAVTEGSAIFPAHGVADFRAGWKRLFAEPDFALTWKTEHVAVTESGSLAYSSGTWKNGNQHGPFIAVWQKQPDGKWKVIIDSAWLVP